MKTTLALNLVRNPMLFDLGLDFRYFQNVTAVKRYINFLDKEFDLVMILEHFDESLLLLKRLLCWELKDILYFKLNERQDKQKQKVIDKEVREDIKSWNKADFMLYQYFYRTFWKKVKAQGPSFQKELRVFKRRKEALSRACLQKGNFLDEAYTGVYVKGYSLKKNVPMRKRKLCENMMKNEISYVKYFREKINNQVKKIEEPDEYLDDPKNDWEVASDLEHDPILSGVGSADAAPVVPKPDSLQRGETSHRTSSMWRTSAILELQVKIVVNILPQLCYYFLSWAWEARGLRCSKHNWANRGLADDFWFSLNF